MRYFIFLFLGAVFFSCGSGQRYTKSPVDVMVRDIPSDHVFSIILHDMDVRGNFVESFHHQYKVIEETQPGQPVERMTDWVEVDKNFFNRHVNDMGMEIAARDSTGKLSKTPAPPGYNNYVGNRRYGYWNNHGGSSFWAFYGQYAFMSSMFNMMTYPVNRGYYDTYRRDYYGRRAYYGPTTSSGRRTYGTGSKYNSSRSSGSSRWSRNTSSFKQKVASRTQRSTSRYGSGTSRYSGSSSSRYGGSSYRSRGGGFGK